MYEDWGLYVQGNVKVLMQWQWLLKLMGFDEYGVYWEVNFFMDGELYFVVYKGDIKVFEYFYFDFFDVRINGV